MLSSPENRLSSDIPRRISTISQPNREHHDNTSFVVLTLSTLLLTGGGAEEANQADAQTAEAAEKLEREREELQTKLVELEWENEDLGVLVASVIVVEEYLRRPVSEDG